MKKNKGFVLVELIVVMGIILLLSGFITFSLIGGQSNTSVTTSAESIISDIESQKIKAMEGYGAQSGQSYGVYLNSNSYVLFNGASYSPSDSSNFAVALDPGLAFINVTFPSNVIVFSSKSGELTSYSNGNSSFTLKDTKGNKTETVIFNRYGVVTSKN